jgi:putative endonuclease
MPPCHGGGRGFESRPVRKSPFKGAYLLMGYYVYIIQSEKDQLYYKGSTEDPVKRLEAHNRGESHYTSSKVPWKLVYVEELPTKREMLIREKKLKRGNAEYFRFLINSSRNLVQKFL